MDDKYMKTNISKVREEPIDDKKSDVENKKNYDYLEPGDEYSFDVGI